MPLDYECRKCTLDFSVGTYHYHSHGSGYFGRSLRVCRNCGVQYSIEIPLDENEKPYRIRRQAKPLLNCKKLEGALLMMPEDGWTEWATLPQQPTEPSDCDACGGETCVTENLPNEFDCPKCGNEISKYRSCWMT